LQRILFTMSPNPRIPTFPVQEREPLQEKPNPLPRIIGGAGCVLALCVVAYFLFRTPAFDAGLMQSNPGLAMTRMAHALDPRAEIVSTDDRARTITVRQRPAGTTVVYRFDPDTKSLVLAVSEMPSWVPVYPGSSPLGSYSAQ